MIDFTNRRPAPSSEPNLTTADAEPAPKYAPNSTAAVARVPLSKRRPTVETKTKMTSAGGEPAPIYRANSINATARVPLSKRRPMTRPKAMRVAADAKGAPDRVPNASPDPARPPSFTAPTQDTTANGAPAQDVERGDRRFVDPLVLQIRELWRRRQAWHRAEKSLTLTASAICRRYVGVQGKGDKVGLKKATALLAQIEDGTVDNDAAMAVLPILMARRQIEPQRKAVEKTLEKFARDLPIAHTVKDTPGFGLLSLAAIVGEAGAPGAYRTVQGLWKRMGLAVFDGERQRCKTDATEAKKHGYSPSRRSVMWNIGGSLIGGMGRGPRPLVGEDASKRDDLSSWQQRFIQRLRYEAEQNPEAMRRDPVERDGELFESYSKHAANRAKRYVEKQFLKYLWIEWRRSTTFGPETTTHCHPVGRRRLNGDGGIRPSFAR